MEEIEEETSSNSEMRFISLELMKLAQSSGKSFKKVAREYIKNTCSLQRMLSGTGTKKKAKLGEKAREK